jgi:hypothetical protein
VLTAARLQANGFGAMKFIAPSNTNMANAITYFDAMVQVPGVVQHLLEFSYHRYGGVSDGNLTAIGNRAVQFGIGTSMLEHIGSGHEDLHKDLKLARNSAWQQFALAFPTNDNGAQYYVVNLSGPTTGTIAMGNRTRYLRQYFRWVRPGMQRIGATSVKPELDPLAFADAAGRAVVVVKASAASAFTIQYLPQGTYGITFTTAGQTGVSAADATVETGGLLSASIPAAGVITIYPK